MSYIDLICEVFQIFKDLDCFVLIQMFNLICLCDKVVYLDGCDCIGVEVYVNYGKFFGLIFQCVGGCIFWCGEFKVMLIGLADESWDLFFIVIYLIVGVFLEMVIDLFYQSEVVLYCQVVVLDSCLVCYYVLEGVNVFGQL